MRILVNFLLFQIGWFACVLGGAHGLPWLGPVVVAAAVAWHLAQAADPPAEGLLLVAAGLIGILFDSALVAAGWLAYPSGQVHPGLAPYWMVAIWVLFATTLNLSLGWLRGRPLLAAMLGGVAGPLAYYGGAQLGGVAFVAPGPGLLALAAGWALLLPLLLWLAARLDGGLRAAAARPLAPAAE